MNEPKKQHYVPQTYLNNFAGGKKGTSLYVFSKSAKKIYPAQVEDTASQRHFYTLENRQDKYMWENIYARKVEPILGQLLKKIRQNCENHLVQNHATVITKDEKASLVYNIIFQQLRGIQTRKYEKDLYNKLLPSVFSDSKKHFYMLEKSVIEESFKKFSTDENYFKEISMQTAFNEKLVEKLFNILIQYSFVFFRSDDISFITSDNPVMITNSITKNVTPFANGLINNTTIIYFPISPSLLLGAFHPEFAFGGINNSDCCVNFLSHKNEKGFINFYNKKQLEQCYNYLYSKSYETLNNLVNRN